MLVIPAVDIKGGNCVRLIQGDASRETIYSGDPLAMAKHWQEQGAKRLHVVDLDGAFSGQMKNMEIILNIAKELDIPVQVGGGIRDCDTVSRLIDGGITRVIMGTSAVYDRDFLAEAFKKWPDRITVGIDSISGNVAAKGWLDVTEKKAVDLAKEMEGMGITEIIVTDVKTDGTLKGPGINLISEVAAGVKISVIASGGVSSIGDIKKLKELNLINLSGVIVGKALYDNNIVLAEAIKTARNGG